MVFKYKDSLTINENFKILRRNHNMEIMNIKNFEVGNTYEGVCLIKDITRADGKNGRYMSFNLQDGTGAIAAKKWEDDPSITGSCFVEATVDVSAYMNKPQAIVRKMKVIEPSKEQKAACLPCSPYDADDMWAVLNNIIAGIEDNELRNLVSVMITSIADKIKTIPAARGVHHDTIGGLLHHTTEMASTAVALARIYPVVNKDLLVAGTILHDYAKVREFAINELGLVDKYTIEGNLLGHLAMGAEMVENEAKKLGISYERILLLKHMILSHHGNREWGAVQLPCTPEASLLFLIDMISSRMEIYRKEYAKLEVGQIADEPCRALDGVRVYKHPLAPTEIPGYIGGEPFES